MNDIDFANINKERRKIWLKFIFVNQWFLNLCLFLCLVGIVFNFFRTLLPQWFVDIDSLNVYYGMTIEQAYKSSLLRTQQSGPLWIFIIGFFSLSLVGLKVFYFRRDFIETPFYLNYYRNYLSNVIAAKLPNFHLGQHCLSFDTIKNSEIVGPNKELMVSDFRGIVAYNGSKQIEGSIDNLMINFGLVVSSAPITHKGQQRLMVVFNKVVFVVKCNNCQPLPGKLKILHDKSQRFFGQTFQKRKLGNETLLQLQDKDFEKDFKIYASDKDFAELILTKSFRDSLSNWKNNWDKKLCLSLVDNTFTIAFPQMHKVLFPRIYKKITPHKVASDIAKLQQLMADFKTMFPESYQVRGNAV